MIIHCAGWIFNLKIVIQSRNSNSICRSNTWSLKIVTQSADRMLVLKIVTRYRGWIFDVERLIRSADRIFDLNVLIWPADGIFDLKVFFIYLFDWEIEYLICRWNSVSLILFVKLKRWPFWWNANFGLWYKTVFFQGYFVKMLSWKKAGTFLRK